MLITPQHHGEQDSEDLGSNAHQNSTHPQEFTSMIFVLRSASYYTTIVSYLRLKVDLNFLVRIKNMSCSRENCRKELFPPNTFRTPRQTPQIRTPQEAIYHSRGFQQLCCRGQFSPYVEHQTQCLYAQETSSDL